MLINDLFTEHFPINLKGHTTLRSYKFIYPLILILAFALCSGLVFAKTDSRKEQYVFAGHDEYAPYSFNSEGEPAGFSVDLVKILAATVNRNIKIELMDWTSCLKELRSGKVDGIIGAPVDSYGIDYMDYSTPISENEYAIFVDINNRYVTSLKSLEGTLVGLHTNCPITKLIKKDGRIATIETENIPELFDKLRNREITAVILEKNVGLYYIQEAKITDLKIAGAPVGEKYPYALAVRKDLSSLRETLNKGITTLKNNKTLKKLNRKWFGLRIVEPFPWKMFAMILGGITGIILMMMASIWMVSLNATVAAKTRQIQLMSQKMVEKDKLAVLGKLAGQIAHELRTPLSIINNSVFLLRKEGSDNREIFEKRLRVLEEKIKLSSNILESILSYSRVKADVAKTISVKECLEEVMKDLEAPEEIIKEVSFEKESFLMVFMDFHQLYSVMRNMCLNAIQAMGKKGTLLVKAYPSGDGEMVNISICDTGPGIVESVQNKIFNLFYSTKITGTGLGLPISKSIIEANGGKLYLEKTDNKGTCFVIKLPSSKTKK